jgi:hypothetical protein
MTFPNLMKMTSTFSLNLVIYSWWNPYRETITDKKGIISTGSADLDQETSRIITEDNRILTYSLSDNSDQNILFFNYR